MQLQSKLNIQTDQDLLLDYKQSGNIDLLGQLYSRYMDLVFGVCLKYFKNSELAKDAVIDIFEKLVHEVLKSDIQSFRPWLYVMSKNFCLMQLRKKEPHKISLDEDRDFVFQIMEKEAEMHPIDREQLFEVQEMALHNCIQKLKSEQKSCIELFYFKEMTYQMISDHLKLEIKKVKSYIQNGKRNLKLCLEKNHE